MLRSTWRPNMGTCTYSKLFGDSHHRACRDGIALGQGRAEEILANCLQCKHQAGSKPVWQTGTSDTKPQQCHRVEVHVASLLYNADPLAGEKQSKCCWVEAHHAHMIGKVCAHKHVVCKCNKSQGHFIFTQALHQEPRFSQRYSNPQLAYHVSCFMPCACTPQLHARDMLFAPPTGLVLQITHSASSQLPQ